MNTINGGISKPVVKITKEDKHYSVVVKVPGVNGEELKVDIQDNMLQVFHVISGDPDSDLPHFPRIILQQYIPHDVNIKRVTAQYADGKLWVTLPFNDLSGGYHRSISIQQL